MKPKTNPISVTPNPEAAKRLREARAAVLAVLPALNANAAPCPHCGLVKREDFHESQLATMIRAFADRLGRWANAAEATRET